LQEPVLFSGTVRRNLDPFDEKCDEEIWQALQQAHLAPLVEQLSGQLQASVRDGFQTLFYVLHFVSLHCV
jgi:ABC-type multidrug transport system fused ATPase/permease subunit